MKKIHIMYSKRTSVTLVCKEIRDYSIAEDILRDHYIITDDVENEDASGSLASITYSLLKAPTTSIHSDIEASRIMELAAAKDPGCIVHRDKDGTIYSIEHTAASGMDLATCTDYRAQKEELR